MIDLAVIEQNLGTIAIAVVGVFALLYVLDYLLELLLGDDADEATSRRAARRTSNRMIGAGTGILGSIIAMGAVGVDAVANAPGAAMTMVGLGGLLADISPSSFLAIAFVVYVVIAAVRGEG